MSYRKSLKWCWTNWQTSCDRSGTDTSFSWIHRDHGRHGICKSLHDTVETSDEKKQACRERVERISWQIRDTSFHMFVCWSVTTVQSTNYCNPLNFLGYSLSNDLENHPCPKMWFLFRIRVETEDNNSEDTHYPQMIPTGSKSDKRRILHNAKAPQVVMDTLIRFSRSWNDEMTTSWSWISSYYLTDLSNPWMKYSTSSNRCRSVFRSSLSTLIHKFSEICIGIIQTWSVLRTFFATFWHFIESKNQIHYSSRVVKIQRQHDCSVGSKISFFRDVSTVEDLYSSWLLNVEITSCPFLRMWSKRSQSS